MVEPVFWERLLGLLCLLSKRIRILRRWFITLFRDSRLATIYHFVQIDLVIHSAEQLLKVVLVRLLELDKRQVSLVSVEVSSGGSHRTIIQGRPRVAKKILTLTEAS